MALIVAGVHRSGTSMVAGILSNLGIPMGDGALMSPAPENPEGFFERIDVMQLNDRILKELGGSWQAPPNLGPDSLFSIDQNFLSHYRSALDLFSGSFNGWFVKDPRISLILPIWDRLALTNLSLIFAVRNPQAVAQSLHLRNGLSHRRTFALWWAYNQQILSNVDSRETLFIDYDSAKRSKKLTTEKIANFALRTVTVSSINPPDFNSGNFDQDRILDAVRVKTAERSINSALSRSSTAKRIKGLAKSEIDETMDFYAVLKKLHGTTNTKTRAIRTPDWVYEELQSARVEFQLSQTIEKLSDHLETSKIEIATLNQLAQSSAQAQSEELDRLQTFLITLEADRDSAQSQALTESAKVKKSAEALSAVSVELSDKLSELNRTFVELDRVKMALVTLQGDLEREQVLSRGLEIEFQNQIRRLEIEFQNQIQYAVLSSSNLENLKHELDSIKSSKGYKLIAKFWKFKEKFHQ